MPKTGIEQAAISSLETNIDVIGGADSGAVGALDADMDAFFAGVRVGNITTDPRVRFDRLAGRWFVLLINTAEANNRLLLAVSDGPSITASSSWTFFHFQQNQPAPTGDNGCFADYPTLGVDAHGRAPCSWSGSGAN